MNKLIRKIGTWSQAFLYIDNTLSGIFNSTNDLWRVLQNLVDTDGVDIPGVFVALITGTEEGSSEEFLIFATGNAVLDKNGKINLVITENAKLQDDVVERIRIDWGNYNDKRRRET